MKVAIVGGGLTGLAAAYRLGESADVTLFESRSTLGGLARAFPVGEELLDCYYHHVFTHDRTFLDYARELGVVESLEWLPSTTAVLAHHALYPFMGPIDLCRYPHLSLPERLRFGLATLLARGLKNYHPLEKRTAKEWLVALFGSNGYEAIWRPLLEKKFEAYTSEISAVWMWGKIALRGSSREKGKERERLGYMRGSFHRFTEALEQGCLKRGIRIKKEAHVGAVSQENGRWSLALPGQGEEAYEQVLLTVPPREILKLAGDALNAEEVRRLGAAKYQGVIVVTLLLDRPLTHYYWININEYGIPFGGVIEHTNLVDPKRYGGHVVYLSRYISPEDPLFDASDDAILRLFCSHLNDLNPAFSRSWIKSAWVFRDAYAQPVIGKDYQDRMPPLKTSAQGLYLATMNHIYPEDRGLNYALELANKVTRTMVQA